MAESDMRAEIIARLDSGKPASSADVLRLLQENENLEAENAQLRELTSGCICQSCGEEFREDVGIPDDLWDRIRPEGKPPGAGLLCGRCIGERIAEENARLLSRIVKLEAALRPFSAIVIEPGSIQEVYLRTEDILAARAALQEKDSPEEEDAI